MACPSRPRVAGVELVFRYEGRAGPATHRASLAADGGSACLELRTLSGGGGLSGGLGGGLGGSSTGAQRLELKFPLKAGRWYHIGVAHEAARLFAKSHATLFVDGKPQHTGQLRYPTTERLTRCFIGTNHATSASSITVDGGDGRDDSDRAGASTATSIISIAQPLRGQVGPC